MTVLEKINDDLIVDDMVYRPSFTELELDEHYYLKLKNGKVEVQKFIGGFVLRNDDEIAEVLEKVPSYEEYQKLLSDQLAKNEGVEINAELEAENTKLKELLKGAKEIIEWYKADCGYKDTPTEVTLQHINQVLGEE